MFDQITFLAQWSLLLLFLEANYFAFGSLFVATCTCGSFASVLWLPISIFGSVS